MKNANGTGSIIKLSGNRRRPYAVKITTGYTIEGKQTRKIIGYFSSKKDALNCLLEYNQNRNIYLNDITFKQCFDKWSKEHYEKINEKTKRVIISLYNNHIFRLNDLILKDVKLYHLQDFINDLKNRNLSSGTLKQARSVLNMVFDYALKNEFINKNVVSFIELGKAEKVIERKIFLDEEIQSLWEHKGKKTVDMILILIYTGMRINELLQLKNENINIEEKYLIAGSKTEAGKNRLIPINYKILPLITRNMNLNSEYLFHTKTGKFIDYATFHMRFKSELNKIGIQEHTIHDTRHTFATLLSNANANSTAIKDIIGHSDYAMTEKVYTHKDKEQLRKAIDLL